MEPDLDGDLACVGRHRSRICRSRRMVCEIEQRRSGRDAATLGSLPKFSADGNRRRNFVSNGARGGSTLDEAK
jgi:hypothetical protein